MLWCALCCFVGCASVDSRKREVSYAEWMTSQLNDNMVHNTSMMIMFHQKYNLDEYHVLPDAQILARAIRERNWAAVENLGAMSSAKILRNLEGNPDVMLLGFPVPAGVELHIYADIENSTSGGTPSDILILHHRVAQDPDGKRTAEELKKLYPCQYFLDEDGNSGPMSYFTYRHASKVLWLLRDIEMDQRISISHDESGKILVSPVENEVARIGFVNAGLIMYFLSQFYTGEDKVATYYEIGKVVEDFPYLVALAETQDMKIQKELEDRFGLTQEQASELLLKARITFVTVLKASQDIDADPPAINNNKENI